MRILLTRTDRVGDLILSTPAIASMRRSFPDAHITLACSRYNAVVVEHSPDIDALVMLGEGENPRAFGARFRDIDLAVALAPRDIDHRLVAATRAPRRVGYTYRRRYLARLLLRGALTDLVLSAADPALAERNPEQIVAHEVDQLLEVVRRAGAETLAHDLVLPISDEDRAAADVLVPHGAIIIQLGRRWTEAGSTTDSCIALIVALRALGRPLIATAAADGHSLANAVREAGVCDGVLTDLPFGVWAAAFARAGCVVTVDTGATHVASAVGTPEVVLFEHRWFALASQEWSPYRVPNAVLRKPPDESDAALRASRAAIVAAVTELL